MKVCLYTHIGCGNRGCEATARSINQILRLDKESMYVFSEDKEEELICGTNQYATVFFTPVVSGIRPIASLLPRILTKLGIDKLGSVKYRYRTMFQNIDEKVLGLSTGGDVFCYNQNLANKIGYLTNNMKKRNNKVCLIACSMEDKHLTKETLEILKSFDYIFPRESLTERNLRNKGLKNVMLYPDPAFVLPREAIKEYTFDPNVDYIGINYSSYTNYGHTLGSKYQTIVNFIHEIVNKTKMNVILIPHVFWPDENDLDLLSKIKNEFSDEKRVILIDRHYNSAQLKYIISQCRYFIGARTHSVIAAYSSGVPTLALGYSIKSKGIAKDIFGDYEHYVYDSKSLDNYDAFYKAFMYIVENENYIRKTLKEKNEIFVQELERQADFLQSLY